MPSIHTYPGVCVCTCTVLYVLRRMATQVIFYTPRSIQELLYQFNCLSQAALGFCTALPRPPIPPPPPMAVQRRSVHCGLSSSVSSFCTYEALTQKIFVVAFKQNNPTSLLNSSSQGSRESIWLPSKPSLHSGLVGG